MSSVSKKIKAEKEREMKEAREKYFNENRLNKTLEFIEAGLKFASLMNRDNSNQTTMSVVDDENGRFEITVKTDTWGYEDFYITSVCDYELFYDELSRLYAAINAIEEKINEENRILNLKKTALEKLTPEERKVLGL